MPKQKKMWDNILTVIMTLLSLLWIYPIVLILLNSLKIEGSFTTSTVFKLPTAETFAGLSNYVYGVTNKLNVALFYHYLVASQGLEQQRRRPQPAAETGRSCWGRVLIFQSPAKGLQKNQKTQPVRP